jgi:hypothetical protein
MVENPDHARAAFEAATDVTTEALEWVANCDFDEIPAALVAAIVDAWRNTVDYDERVAMFVFAAGA